MTEKINFDNWMRNTIKSLFYSDNEQMCNAYNKVIEQKSVTKK